MKALRLTSVALLLLVACGGDDDGDDSRTDAGPGGSDAAGGADATAGSLEGAYARVIPGYETEAACRAENPDKLFACVELVSLCADDEAFILFTDIVFDGVWSEDGSSATITFETWDGAFSDDGTTVFERQPDGSLLSDEVYGDRAFARSDDEGESLCP